MADHLTKLHAATLTNESLISAYKEIIETLAESRIAATFAFVGAFTFGEEYFRGHWLHRIKESEQHRNWLGALFADLAKDSHVDGWFVPDLLEIVQSAKECHEISSHGFTHLPFVGASDFALDLELEGVKDWVSQNRLAIDTFIFPRNLASHVNRLREIGVVGYRERPRRAFGGRLGRVENILLECIPYASSQRHPRPGSTPLAIPGNFFLNWRSGVRSLVPIGVTLEKLRRALRIAVSRNEVVHVWLHPHNLLTGERQSYLFKRSIELIADEVQKGNIVVQTQSEYCRDVQRALMGHTQ